MVPVLVEAWGGVGDEVGETDYGVEVKSKFKFKYIHLNILI